MVNYFEEFINKLIYNSLIKEVVSVRYEGKSARDVKIAYIGGGSRGWAWLLMSDLVSCPNMSGEVALYDIDFEAAQANEVIGNRFNDAKDAVSHWDYKAVKTIGEALAGADFVVISILPGTFDEMESDVHLPEQYGIYQSVGDTAGPGGIVRAMRTLPMIAEIAENVKNYCPKAWVINYTNPMTLCVKQLYDTFPDIRAFGCCHEVFGTQKVLKAMYEEFTGETVDNHTDIKVNPVAINHFTWLTTATYKNRDLYPMYRDFCEKYHEAGYHEDVDQNWMNNFFASGEKVKMDLFLRYGVIAAAGDRHLAEFCEGNWYLASPERAKEMQFGLTPVSWRKETLQSKRDRSKRLVSGEEETTIVNSGEEGVNQMCALLGLCDLVTNVNIPNRGQIPNLPIGAVVETNATFRADSLNPVFAGEVPPTILPLVSRVCAEQEAVFEGIKERDVKKIFNAFVNDPLVTCSIEDAKTMFKQMCENTKAYLAMYHNGWEAL